MASSNNDRTVSGKAYAWRLLGMMPGISKAATVAQTSEWRAELRTRLYHSCIDILVAQINDLTGKHSVCWQIGPTLSCMYGLFIYGRWWGVHCHYVSNDTVRKLLVSQGTTAGLWPCVPVQRHTGDSRWVGNRASATAESRWNGTWQVQGQGKFLMSYIKYILEICMTYTMNILCISKK